MSDQEYVDSPFGGKTAVSAINAVKGLMEHGYTTVQPGPNSPVLQFWEAWLEKGNEEVFVDRRTGDVTRRTYELVKETTLEINGTQMAVKVSRYSDGGWRIDLPEEADEDDGSADCSPFDACAETVYKFLESEPGFDPEAGVNFFVGGKYNGGE